MKKIIKGGDAVTTYSSRTNATAPLRKMGIKTSDYDMFVMPTTNGRFAVNLEKAREFLQARLRKVATKEVPQAKNLGRTAKEAASNQVARPTVAGTIRALILKGMDNKAIHEVMKRDFGHDEDKAHYPGWYRSQMRREGLVAKAPKRVKKQAAKKPAKKAKPAKAKKAAPRSARKPKTSAKKAAKKPLSRAQGNINATKRASVKTGNRLPTPGPLSVTMVH
jgi:hypothetical protein